MNKGGRSPGGTAGDAAPFSKTSSRGRVVQVVGVRCGCGRRRGREGERSEILWACCGKYFFFLSLFLFFFLTDLVLGEEFGQDLGDPGVSAGRIGVRRITNKGIQRNAVKRSRGSRLVNPRLFFFLFLFCWRVTSYRRTR